MPRPQFDTFAKREAVVVVALVDLLPKKVCMCDLPAWPGKTIGSSAR